MYPLEAENELEKVRVVTLTETCSHYFAAFNSFLDDEPRFDIREHCAKLGFLSMAVGMVATIVANDRRFREEARLFSQLRYALEDLADGRSSQFLQPCKDVGAQPVRIPSERYLTFPIATAVYDLAEPGTKKATLETIAGYLKIKPSVLRKFRRNLLRKNPNIKALKAHELHKFILNGGFRVDENGHFDPTPGPPSPAAFWLKWFERSGHEGIVPPFNYTVVSNYGSPTCEIVRTCKENGNATNP